MRRLGVLRVLCVEYYRRRTSGKSRLTLYHREWGCQMLTVRSRPRTRVQASYRLWLLLLGCVSIIGFQGASAAAAVGPATSTGHQPSSNPSLSVPAVPAPTPPSGAISHMPQQPQGLSNQTRPTGALRRARFCPTRASSATFCVSVGDVVTSTTSQVVTNPLAEMWNGSTWTPEEISLPSGASDGTLNGVSCLSSASCVAVGDYPEPGTNIYRPLIERWNGIMWSVEMAAALPPTTSGYLKSVSCTSDDFCTAVGYSDDGVAMTLAEGWNGRAWSMELTEAGDASDAELAGVSCTSSLDCTAVGSETTGAGLTVAVAELWEEKTLGTPRRPTTRCRDIFSNPCPAAP